MNPEQRIRSQSCGAKFFRIDLHIHSLVGSHDVSDPDMTPEKIITTATTENVDIIAITDHNSIRNVKELQKKAETKIEVIPGVELSTPEGHLLVYFSSYKDLENTSRNLSLLIAIPPDRAVKHLCLIVLIVSNTRKVSPF